MTGRKTALAIGVLITGVALASFTFSQEEPRYDEYSVVVASGETLWDKCSKVNHGREDVRRVIARTLKENNISDVGMIQPGQRLTIRVLR